MKGSLLLPLSKGLLIEEVSQGNGHFLVSVIGRSTHPLNQVRYSGCPCPDK